MVAKQRLLYLSVRVKVYADLHIFLSFHIPHPWEVWQILTLLQRVYISIHRINIVTFFLLWFSQAWPCACIRKPWQKPAEGWNVGNLPSLLLWINLSLKARKKSSWLRISQHADCAQTKVGIIMSYCELFFYWLLVMFFKKE